MKKLGEGWQYSVYDLGNGRVLKKYHPPLRTLWIILKDIIPGELSGLFKIHEYIPDLKRKAILSFEILERHSIPPELLGHPMRLNQLDYEQDKITPLHAHFERASVQEAKHLVDQFIAFNQELLRYGVIDKFFNITKNFGLDVSGKMVLIDLGELEDREDRIFKQRQKRVWAVPYKLKWIKNKDVRQYFVERMDEAFGIQGSSTLHPMK